LLAVVVAELITAVEVALVVTARLLQENLLAAEHRQNCL
jgi:hypothetical protein